MATTLRSSLLQLLLATVTYCAGSAVANAQSCKMPPGNPTCASDSTSQSSPNPSTGAGNPIDILSGNKYQQETDLDMGGDLSIGFRRHYNSVQSQAGVLGRGWTHTYETQLSRSERRTAAGGQKPAAPSITVTQADGREISFETFETSGSVRRYRSVPSGYGVIEEDVAGIERLRQAVASNRAVLLDDQAVWTWRWSDGRALTFNGRGLLHTVARADGHGLKLQYDAQRRFIRVSDDAGNWMAATYWDNAAERLQAFSPASAGDAHGGGYRGRLQELSLSGGDRIRYAYDAHGNLKDVEFADGTRRRYEYVRAYGHDLLARIYGRDGRLFSTYEYDGMGRATRSSHPDHRDDVTLSYRLPNLRQPLGQTIVEDAAGARTTYTWRANAQTQLPLLVAADGPGCRTCAASDIRYEYDAEGRVVRAIRVDAHGIPIEQTVYSNDALGRLRALEIAPIADGRAQKASWRESRSYEGSRLRPSLITRPSVVPGREHTLRVEYNDHDQPTRITENGFQFDEPDGLLQASLQAPARELERVTQLTYVSINGRSLLRSIDGPLPGAGDTWTYEYDAAGRIRTVLYPMRLQERFEHDAWGRITVHTGVDGVRDTFVYGSDGNITRFAHGDSWMAMGYDESGRITRVLDSLGQQLRLTRNERGEVTAIADAQDNRIEWKYGDHGELREFALLDPDGTLSQHGHLPLADDMSGNVGGRYGTVRDESMLSSLTGALPEEIAAALPHWNDAQLQIGLRTVYGADRRATSYVYDDFGRLTSQHSPVSGVTRFQWDLSDHLIERSGEDDSVTRIYRDALGRAIRVRAGPEDGRIEWGSANRPSRVVYNGGEERYDYDPQARLTGHELLVDGRRYRISYEFDVLGRLSRKHLPDGSVLRYRYNGPLHPKPGVLAGIYREGLVERPIISGVNTADEHLNSRGFTFGNGLTARLLLDVNGNVFSDGNPKVGESRLTSDQNGTVEATYRHAAGVGDRPNADVVPPWTDRLVGQVSELGTAGERTAPGTGFDSYFVNAPSYDARGQLVQDSQRRYEWDALGRLVGVYRNENSGFIKADYSPSPGAGQRKIAEYRYNLFGQRIAKVTYGADGGTPTYFLWDGDEIAAEIDQAGRVTRDYVYFEGRPVAILAGRAIYSIHSDHRMAPIAVTDASRRVVWQADVHENGAADVAKGSMIELPLRASNQYFDTETGLHYNVYRYLDAKRGRYLSPDPMGLAAGPDLYQFALGRPHSFVDPLGLQATPTNWSTATYEAKFSEIIKRAIPLVPQEIGAALNKLVQPATLASMVLIMGVFAGMQATPIGWIADAAILAYSAWMLGSGLVVLIKTLVQLNTDTNNAKCDADITAASKRLAAGFVTGSGDVVGGLAGVWGVKSSGGLTRIANGITTLVDYAKNALGITDAASVVLQGAAGAAPGVGALQGGLGGTVSNSLTKITWTTTIQGIGKQGLAFEDYVGTTVASTDRLPPNFMTFDFYDPITRVATSVKTLNTQAPGYLSNPGSIYGSLMKYINAMDQYQTYTLSGTTLSRAQIASEEMQLAIPSSTNAAQWTQINRAIAAAKAMGIKLTVTVIN